MRPRFPRQFLCLQKTVRPWLTRLVAYPGRLNSGSGAASVASVPSLRRRVTQVDEMRGRFKIRSTEAGGRGTLPRIANTPGKRKRDSAKGFWASPWLAEARRWGHALKREIDEGGLDYRAMSLVYTSLLSLAPLLALSFSVLKAFGLHNRLQPFLLEVLAPLGGKAYEVTDRIIDFVENIQVGVLGFVGFVMLFYTVISLLGKIENTFNHIWRVPKPRNFLRRFSDYLSVLLVGPVLVVSALGILASMGNTELVQQIIAKEPFGTAYYVAGLILPYLLIVAAFTFAFLFIPNTAVKLRPALVGGVAAGLAWELSGSLFAGFVADSAKYSAIYSAFAAIILFMIWVYISWFILLLGGVIAFYCQYPRYLRYASRHPSLSIQCKEQLGLLLMSLIGRRHFRGEPAWTLHELAEAVNLPWETVGEILACLQQSHLVVALSEEAKSYVPAKDTDAILLKDIVQAIRSAGETLSLSTLSQGDAAENLHRVLAVLEEASPTPLKDRSLREIIAHESGRA
jgi:membrane protein